MVEEALLDELQDIGGQGEGEEEPLLRLLVGRRGLRRRRLRRILLASMLGEAA